MRDVDLMSPERVAAEYGGDKRRIAQAAQAGILNPTVAVMAGMFIDRMRAAAAKEQQPNTTVAEEVLPPRAAGLEAARAAPPVERGLDALPVPEDAVPSFESGGIVAFEDGGLTSPFARDIEAFAEAGRRSVAERTPGMVGAYSRPLVSEEDQERMRLRQMIEQKYGPRGSLIQGYFMNQTPAQREEAKNILSRLPSMSLDEMRMVAGGAAPTSGRGLTAIAPPPPGTSVADMMKTVPGDMALRSAPGKTPEQSAQDIAAARQTREKTVAKAEDREVIPKAGRSSIAPASFEEALGKAKSALGGLPKEDVFADIKAELAERKGKSSEDLRQAAWMRLAEAGFGATAGTSPYALVNFGKSAVQSIKSYGEDLKEQRKLDREDRKLLADIRRLEKAEARDDIFKTTELAYKIYNEANDDVRSRLASDTTLAAARISAAGRPTQYEQLTADLRSPDPTRRSAAERFLGQAKMGTLTYEEAAKIVANANPLLMMKGKEQEFQAAVQNLLAGQRGGTGSSQFKVLGREGA